jgi:uncharacterized membrane protein YqiK
MELGAIIAPIVILIVAAIAIMLIFSKLYRKATKEMSLVRTGWGGQKVIIDGGCLELPVLHDIISVNMQTLRLEVLRMEKEALITKDRMRVDVAAEFYVRVKPDKESVPIAAQTLGTRTLDKDALKALIEGKFIDALRSVAAEMEMEELHEQRSNFVQKVQGAVEEDLSKNGLELESVSLTSLDQTNREHLDPNNAFDAQGLTKITETVEANNKMRNDLVRKAEVEIAQRNLETEQQKLLIGKEEKLAQINQEKEIKFLVSKQEAEVAKTRAEQENLAEQAQLESQRKIEQTRIENAKQVEQAKILKDREIEEAKIGKVQKIEERKIVQEKTIKLAEQLKSIEISNKSQEESQAKAKADEAKALAVAAEEEVTTVREKATAERKKAIAIIKAEEKAEEAAVALVKAANAQGEAAKLEAEAIKVKALAKEEQYRVDAEGERITNEAKNTLSSELISLELKRIIADAAPSIIAEMVKPIDKIDSIKIMDLKGLGNFGNGNGANGDSVSNSSGSNLAQQAMNAALQYKAQVPFLKNILSEIGIEDGFDKMVPSDLMEKVEKSKEEPEKKSD